ncbi:MAG: pyruvate kinase [Clostridiales bacterium]|nr:pyruvate kinase [Clostridiales bacterium]
MRKTKIVCTIGPACDSEEMLRKMILAGMNVARLNFSHGTHEDHKAKIDKLKKLREELDVPVAILLDTKGPEIRTGKLENGEVELVSGSELVLTTEETMGTGKRVSVTYKNLPRNLAKGNTLMLDDGLIELCVRDITETEIICDIVSGETLKNSKSLNVPGVAIDMPFISKTDESDILFGIENDVDFIALSFVRTPQDVKDVRRLLHANSCYSIELISKIENTEGVKNIAEIINVSDGIMVARGDMGVEIPFEELPHIQKDIIRRCYTAGKAVITATQMLDSMMHHPRPTRAEITDVANAIYDRTSALMLSGETASGAYPLKSLETMSKIAEKTESSINYKLFERRFTDREKSSIGITDAISDATCKAAQALGASAIIAVTLSGQSARMISKFRPDVPIIAFSPNKKTYYHLSLSWGVTPMMNAYIENTHELFNDVVKKTAERSFVKNGDIVLVTGSTQYFAGTTNSLQVHIVGNILLKGTGNGEESVTGLACVIKEEDKDLGSFKSGDILVVSRTTHEVLRLMRQCSGVITEESESESGIAAAGCALEIPVVSSAKGATSVLKTGYKIKIDAKSGYIYNSDMNGA